MSPGRQARPSERREDRAPVSAAVLDAAIDWQLRLGSGAAGAAERAAFEGWLAADPAHGRAWRQLGEIDDQLRPAQAAPARRVLLRSRPVRRTGRRAAAGLAAVALACLGLLGLDREIPLRGLVADHATHTGERRRVALPDGSILHLNTRTAVDLAFDGQRRALRLHGGEIAVETAHDAADARPFVVLTADGSLRALGTRFLVQRLPEGTLLTVVRSAVAAEPAGGSAARVVREGERALVGPSGVRALPAGGGERDAWVDGMLVVDDAPLSEVVAELARYRRGRLTTDPAVAGLRVTGTFPLDDTDAALAALARGLPVRLARTPLWVTVEARE